MKKLRMGLMAFALVAGISGAFAMKAVHTPSANETDYEWIHYNRSGVPIGTFTGTVEEATAALDCDGSTNLKCADAPGAPVILNYD